MVSLIKREYDYGMRISAYLASHYPDGGKTIPELSKILEITKSLTTRIVYLLIQGGILRSRKGRYGGIFLNVNPETTSMMDILKAMNYNSVVNSCLVDKEICPLVVVCPIRRKFSYIDDEIIEKFSKILLKDLIIRDNMLP